MERRSSGRRLSPREDAKQNAASTPSPGNNSKRKSQGGTPTCSSIMERRSSGCRSSPREDAKQNSASTPSPGNNSKRKSQRGTPTSSKITAAWKSPRGKAGWQRRKSLSLDSKNEQEQAKPRVTRERKKSTASSKVRVGDHKCAAKHSEDIGAAKPSGNICGSTANKQTSSPAFSFAEPQSQTSEANKQTTSPACSLAEPPRQTSEANKQTASPACSFAEPPRQTSEANKQTSSPACSFAEPPSQTSEANKQTSLPGFRFPESTCPTSPPNKQTSSPAPSFDEPQCQASPPNKPTSSLGSSSDKPPCQASPINMQTSSPAPSFDEPPCPSRSIPDSFPQCTSTKTGLSFMLAKSPPLVEIVSQPSDTAALIHVVNNNSSEEQVVSESSSSFLDTSSGSCSSSSLHDSVSDIADSDIVQILEMNMNTSFRPTVLLHDIKHVSHCNACLDAKHSSSKDKTIAIESCTCSSLLCERSRKEVQTEKVRLDENEEQKETEETVQGVLETYLSPTSTHDKTEISKSCVQISGQSGVNISSNDEVKLSEIDHKVPSLDSHLNSSFCSVQVLDSEVSQSSLKTLDSRAVITDTSRILGSVSYLDSQVSSNRTNVKQSDRPMDVDFRANKSHIQDKSANFVATKGAKKLKLTRLPKSKDNPNVEYSVSVKCEDSEGGTSEKMVTSLTSDSGIKDGTSVDDVEHRAKVISPFGGSIIPVTKQQEPKKRGSSQAAVSGKGKSPLIRAGRKGRSPYSVETTTGKPGGRRHRTKRQDSNFGKILDDLPAEEDFEPDYEHEEDQEEESEMDSEFGTTTTTQSGGETGGEMDNFIINKFFSSQQKIKVEDCIGYMNEDENVEKSPPPQLVGNRRAADAPSNAERIETLKQNRDNIKLKICTTPKNTVPLRMGKKHDDNFTKKEELVKENQTAVVARSFLEEEKPADKSESKSRTAAKRTSSRTSSIGSAKSVSRKERKHSTESVSRIEATVKEKLTDLATEFRNLSDGLTAAPNRGETLDGDLTKENKYGGIQENKDGKSILQESSSSRSRTNSTEDKNGRITESNKTNLEKSKSAPRDTQKGKKPMGRYESDEFSKVLAKAGPSSNKRKNEGESSDTMAKKKSCGKVSKSVDTKVVESSQKSAKVEDSSLKAAKVGDLSKKSAKVEALSQTSATAGESSQKSIKAEESSQKSTKAGESSLKSTKAGESSLKSTKAGESSQKSTKAGESSLKSTKAGESSQKSAKAGESSQKSIKAGESSQKVEPQKRKTQKFQMPGSAKGIRRLLDQGFYRDKTADGKPCSRRLTQESISQLQGVLKDIEAKERKKAILRSPKKADTPLFAGPMTKNGSETDRVKDVEVKMSGIKPIETVKGEQVKTVEQGNADIGENISKAEEQHSPLILKLSKDNPPLSVQANVKSQEGKPKSKIMIHTSTKWRIKAKSPKQPLSDHGQSIGPSDKVDANVYEKSEKSQHEVVASAKSVPAVMHQVSDHGAVADKASVQNVPTMHKDKNPDEQPVSEKCTPSATNTAHTAQEQPSEKAQRERSDKPEPAEADIALSSRGWQLCQPAPSAPVKKRFDNTKVVPMPLSVFLKHMQGGAVEETSEEDEEENEDIAVVTGVSGESSTQQDDFFKCSFTLPEYKSSSKNDPPPELPAATAAAPEVALEVAPTVLAKMESTAVCASELMEPAPIVEDTSKQEENQREVTRLKAATHARLPVVDLGRATDRVQAKPAKSGFMRSPLRPKAKDASTEYLDKNSNQRKDNLGATNVTCQSSCTLGNEVDESEVSAAFKPVEHSGDLKVDSLEEVKAGGAKVAEPVTRKRKINRTNPVLSRSSDGSSVSPCVPRSPVKRRQKRRLGKEDVPKKTTLPEADGKGTPKPQLAPKREKCTIPKSSSEIKALIETGCHQYLKDDGTVVKKKLTMQSIALLKKKLIAVEAKEKSVKRVATATVTPQRQVKPSSTATETQRHVKVHPVSSSTPFSKPLRASIDQAAFEPDVNIVINVTNKDEMEETLRVKEEEMDLTTKVDVKDVTDSKAWRIVNQVHEMTETWFAETCGIFSRAFTLSSHEAVAKVIHYYQQQRQQQHQQQPQGDSKQARRQKLTGRNANLYHRASSQEDEPAAASSPKCELSAIKPDGSMLTGHIQDSQLNGDNENVLNLSDNHVAAFNLRKTLALEKENCKAGADKGINPAEISLSPFDVASPMNGQDKRRESVSHVLPSSTFTRASTHTIQRSNIAATSVPETFSESITVKTRQHSLSEKDDDTTTSFLAPNVPDNAIDGSNSSVMSFEHSEKSLHASSCGMLSTPSMAGTSTDGIHSSSQSICSSVTNSPKLTTPQRPLHPGVTTFHRPPPGQPSNIEVAVPAQAFPPNKQGYPGPALSSHALLPSQSLKTEDGCSVKGGHNPNYQAFAPSPLTSHPPPPYTGRVSPEDAYDKQRHFQDVGRQFCSEDGSGPEKMQPYIHGILEQKHHAGEAFKDISFELKEQLQNREVVRNRYQLFSHRVVLELKNTQQWKQVMKVLHVIEETNASLHKFIMSGVTDSEKNCLDLECLFSQGDPHGVMNMLNERSWTGDNAHVGSTPQDKLCRRVAILRAVMLLWQQDYLHNHVGKAIMLTNNLLKQWKPEDNVLLREWDFPHLLTSIVEYVIYSKDMSSCELLALTLASPALDVSFLYHHKHDPLTTLCRQLVHGDQTSKRKAVLLFRSKIQGINPKYPKQTIQMAPRNARFFLSVCPGLCVEDMYLVMMEYILSMITELDKRSSAGRHIEVEDVRLSLRIWTQLKKDKLFMATLHETLKLFIIPLKLAYKKKDEFKIQHQNLIKCLHHYWRENHPSEVYVPSWLKLDLTPPPKPPCLDLKTPPAARLVPPVNMAQPFPGIQRQESEPDLPNSFKTAHIVTILTDHSLEQVFEEITSCIKDCYNKLLTLDKNLVKLTLEAINMHVVIEDVPVENDDPTKLDARHQETLNKIKCVLKDLPTPLRIIPDRYGVFVINTGDFLKCLVHYWSHRHNYTCDRKRFPCWVMLAQQLGKFSVLEFTKDLAAAVKVEQKPRVKVEYQVRRRGTTSAVSGQHSSEYEEGELKESSDNRTPRHSPILGKQHPHQHQPHPAPQDSRIPSLFDDLSIPRSSVPFPQHLKPPKPFNRFASNRNQGPVYDRPPRDPQGHAFEEQPRGTQGLSFERPADHQFEGHQRPLGPGFQVPSRRFEGPFRRHDVPSFEGPSRGPQGPGLEGQSRDPQGPGFKGQPKAPQRPNFDGPSREHDRTDCEGPSRAPQGPHFEEHSRGPQRFDYEGQGSGFERLSRGSQNAGLEEQCRQPQGAGFEEQCRRPQGSGFEEQWRQPQGAGFEGPSRGPQRTGFGGPQRPDLDGPPREQSSERMHVQPQRIAGSSCGPVIFPSMSESQTQQQQTDHQFQQHPNPHIKEEKVQIKSESASFPRAPDFPQYAPANPNDHYFPPQADNILLQPNVSRPSGTAHATQLCPPAAAASAFQRQSGDERVCAILNVFKQQASENKAYWSSSPAHLTTLQNSSKLMCDFSTQSAVQIAETVCQRLVFHAKQKRVLRVEDDLLMQIVMDFFKAHQADFKQSRGQLTDYLFDCLGEFTDAKVEAMQNSATW